MFLPLSSLIFLIIFLLFYFTIVLYLSFFSLFSPLFALSFFSSYHIFLLLFFFILSNFFHLPVNVSFFFLCLHLYCSVSIKTTSFLLSISLLYPCVSPLSYFISLILFLRLFFPIILLFISHSPPSYLLSLHSFILFLLPYFLPPIFFHSHPASPSSC